MLHAHCTVHKPKQLKCSTVLHILRFISLLSALNNLKVETSMLLGIYAVFDQYYIQTKSAVLIVTIIKVMSFYTT